MALGSTRTWARDAEIQGGVRDSGSLETLSHRHI